MVLKYSENELLFGESQKNLLSMTEDYRGPFYVYDLKGIEKRLNQLKSAFTKSVSIHYAVKANPNHEVLKFFNESGIGADVVSKGEIEECLGAGFLGNRIIFSGVAKTERDIQIALDLQIRQINVESPSELRRIGKIAKQKGVQAPVAFRMNPDVNPNTHPYITTGFRENKFGLDESFLPELEKILAEYKDSLRLVGLTMHIGSQITDLSVFGEALDKTRPIFLKLRQAGHMLQRFDVGGGVGIDYQNDNEETEFQKIREYAHMVESRLGDLNCEIQCEPGRWLVAHHGVLITQVQYVKKTPHKNFLIVDSGMHHLMRPALYQAEHKIFPLLENKGTAKCKYDIVGPICESTDFLGKNRELHEVQEGDFLAVADAGAYGMSMASTYNKHELPDEVII